MPQVTREEFLQNPSQCAEKHHWNISLGWFRQAWSNRGFKEVFLGSEKHWDFMHQIDDYCFNSQTYRFLKYLTPEDFPELDEIVRRRLKLSEYIWRESFLKHFPLPETSLAAIQSPPSGTVP